MPENQDGEDTRMEQGRELARLLYDFNIPELESLGPEKRVELLEKFPLLGEAEFEDVVRQVTEAKRYQQEYVGWQAIPHDLSVLALVGVTSLVNLRAGVVTGVAVLVLLEGFFQYYFNRQLYRFLSGVVWLTYPAYVLLAYVLYRRGFEIIWIAAVVLLTWGGTFVLGALARIPVRLVREAQDEAEEGPA